jgi:hypothetical protein
VELPLDAAAVFGHVGVVKEKVKQRLASEPRV